MKKIITFICFAIICIGLNSCAIFTDILDDDYIYSNGACYHTHSVYYRPVLSPSRHYHSKPIPPSPKPKPHYHKPQPKPTPHPHSHQPHNSKDNHNHNRR